MSDRKTVTIALIGNPNTGKSTLFSALAGVRQRVGNYPGVTVEKKVGRAEIGGRRCTIVDLPGTYSLAPFSPDEMIVVDLLLGRTTAGEAPDVILCIVDASNLSRNLYLVSQILELGRPVVVALNMIDIAAARGIVVDTERLRRRLGVPVVAIQANRKVGLSELKEAISEAAAGSPPRTPGAFPETFQREVLALEARQEGDGREPLPRYLLERLLLDASGYLQSALGAGVDGTLRAEVQAARRRLSEAGVRIPGVEVTARYGWVDGVLDGVIQRPAGRQTTWSDRIDRVLMHRLWGGLIFVAVMAVLFQAVFYIAAPASAAIDWLKAGARGWVESGMAEGPLQSLIVKGVIEGVGGVLVFLPQIFTLFLFIALLEDCGYMARAAYLMDRMMARIGLNGKSFIPLLCSFACAIPGIMASRVIENRRDRLATILVAPLMSCSARLPIYVLLAAAFIPDTRLAGGLLGLQGLVIFAMYALGIATAVCVALILKRTLLQGAAPPFVMELPSYKAPGPSVVLNRMLQRGWAFIRQAGTLIFAVSILVWAAAYYPRRPESLPSAAMGRRAELARRIDQLEAALAAAPSAEAQARLRQCRSRLQRVDNEIEGAYLRASYLGRAGRIIEPLVRPLGWDWRIGCAVIAAFPAREVVIATLGVIYNLGEEAGEDPATLQQALRDAKWEGTQRPVFCTPVALSLMIFFALCAQCVSTLAVIRRETNSWRWPAFTFAYMTVLAYLGAMAAYQIGMRFV